MSSGYGRGYYGTEQLARPARPPTRTWVKVAVVAGVGAVVWLMWPRSKAYDFDSRGSDGDGGEPKAPPAPALPPPPGSQLQLPASGPDAGQLQLATTPNAFEGLPPLPAPQLTQEALARGYPSQQAYEDAVVDIARQLQETGGRVTLASHLQHLAPRVGPTT